MYIKIFIVKLDTGTKLQYLDTKSAQMSARFFFFVIIIYFYFFYFFLGFLKANFEATRLLGIVSP